MLFLSSFVILSCTSVCWCLVVTCWERVDLLTLVCDVQLWCCHIPIGILGLVWCLIVSIPDLYPRSYFVYICIYIVPSWADQHLPELLFEQFDALPSPCKHIVHMHEGFYFKNILTKWELWELRLWNRGLSCKSNIFVPWSTSELRQRLAPWNRFKPSSKIFLLTVPRPYFFVDHLCFLCLMFLMLSRLFIPALLSPAGKGLTSWLLLGMFIVFLLLSHMVSCVRCGTWMYRFLIFAVFLTFLFCICIDSAFMGQSIPDTSFAGINQKLYLHTVVVLNIFVKELMTNDIYENIYIFSWIIVYA